LITTSRVRLASWLSLTSIATLAGTCQLEYPDHAPPPDVSGRWMFSLAAFPVGTEGGQGDCVLQSLAFELAQLPFDGRDSLDGTHGPGTLGCSTFSGVDSQLSTLSDTTIHLEAGRVTGLVGWMCTEGVGPMMPWCPVNSPLVPWVELSVIGQRFRGELTADTLRGSFEWGDTVLYGTPATVLYGSWTAVRQGW